MKKKEFDCVQMKWDIQQKIQHEYESMEDISAHEKQMAEVLQNPTLGPYIKKVQEWSNYQTKKV